MAKKTPIEALRHDIEQILEEYGEEVHEYVDEVTQAVAKKGVKALRSATRSTFGGEGIYAKGWACEVETSRIGPSTVTIYNNHPGLPHLLENGHAKRGGGRVPGRAHIAPVEKVIIAELEEAITKI